MDITTLSVTELKALAYEQMLALTNAQRNIAGIEQELAKRLNTSTPPTEETSNAD